MDTSVVYGIKDKKTGMYYVGSTRELEVRWASHRSLLEAGEHTPKLQSAWDDSDPNDWEWLILEKEIPVIH
jgi:GIY-YIG catalytic domain-containing protein